MHLDDRPFRELRLLLLDGFEALIAVERVARVHRPVPVARSARHEHVDAAERRPRRPSGARSPFIGRVEDRRHRRRCDLRAPTRRRGRTRCRAKAGCRRRPLGRSCEWRQEWRPSAARVSGSASRRRRALSPRRCRDPAACTWWLLRTRESVSVTRSSFDRHRSIGRLVTRAGTRRARATRRHAHEGQRLVLEMVPNEPDADAGNRIGETHLATRAHVPEGFVVRTVLPRQAGHERGRLARVPSAQRLGVRMTASRPAHLFGAEALDRRARYELLTGGEGAVQRAPTRGPAGRADRADLRMQHGRRVHELGEAGLVRRRRRR